MKKAVIVLCLFTLIQICEKTSGQGFIKDLDSENMGTLFGNECVAKLKTGEEIAGKLTGGMMINGGLTRVTIKLENGEKARFKPEDVVFLSVKASDLTKLSMISESMVSIKEMVNADFDNIVKREYVIFETAMTPAKKDTYRLLQLLNPGFDSKIKVFATEKKTGGFSIGDIAVTGGADRAYLFVKRGAKAVEVKKSNYRNNFEELYSDCPDMLAKFQGEKIKWNDIAGHVYVYDQMCK